ncbi:MAG: gamma-butyrobetaine hydroxylase-like domain-containing protein [Alphaproteobacteria bacterium]
MTAARVAELGTQHWPVEIRLKQAEKLLEVDFDDGVSYRYPAEYLRVESPSAEVQGHGPSQKQLVSGRRHVGILALEPVGNYALRISFDDLHDTGIFTWAYLYELGQQQTEKWQHYLAAIAASGLSREPPKRAGA